MAGKADFRDDAVAASEALLAQRGGHAADPLDAHVSFCLRAAGEGDEVLRRAKRRLLLAGVLGFSGIVAGGLIAFWLKLHGVSSEAEEWRMLGVAAACSVGGFALLFTQISLLRRLVRRRVRERLDAMGAQTEQLRPIPVTIGSWSSGVAFKIMPEDAGLLILQPEQRSVRIEGMTHRYFIRAADCSSVTLSGGESQYSETGVRVTYRTAAAVVLDISIKPDSTMKQVGYSLSGKVPALFDQVRSCLAPMSS
jgi:hypothetical protein